MDHMVSANVWDSKETLKPHSCPRVPRRQQNDHFQSLLWFHLRCDLLELSTIGDVIADMKEDYQLLPKFEHKNKLLWFMVQSTICAINYLWQGAWVHCLILCWHVFFSSIILVFTWFFLIYVGLQIKECCSSESNTKLCSDIWYLQIVVLANTWYNKNSAQ